MYRPRRGNADQTVIPDRSPFSPQKFLDGGEWQAYVVNVENVRHAFVIHKLGRPGTGEAWFYDVNGVDELMLPYMKITTRLGYRSIYMQKGHCVRDAPWQSNACLLYAQRALHLGQRGQLPDTGIDPEIQKFGR